MNSDMVLKLVDVVGHTEFGSIGTDAPINLELKKGQLGMVLGGRWASLLFRIVMGHGELVQGNIYLSGELILDSKNKKKLPRNWVERIGFGFRENGLFSNMSILENVDLPAHYHGMYKTAEEVGSRAEKLLREFVVPKEAWSKRPDTIDWFLRKKAILARSVVMDPEVLFLDDPSILVPWSRTNEVLAWLAKQKYHGRGIIIGTDDYPFGLAICDWVWDPEKGLIEEKDFGSFPSEWTDSAQILKKKIPEYRGLYEA